MASILETIAAKARERVAARKGEVSPEAMARQAEALAAAELAYNAEQGICDADGCPCFRFPFRENLARPGLSFICEAKKASPSAGVIAEDFPYLRIAEDYAAAGAAAISVLTEPVWFQGADAYLREIAERVDVPVLRKDFVVDAYLVDEARVLGARAVLLITSLLDDEQLAAFIRRAHELGMDALVEARTEQDVERAVAAGARIIGVNNRNLADFSVDFGQAARLREKVPADVLFVAESGVKGPEDVAALAATGADAVLIGTALMTAPDRQAALRELRQAAERVCPTRPVRPADERYAPAIKFCGLTCEADVEAANAAQADFAGFVFAPASKRAITPEEAAVLRARLAPSVRPVGVFVDADEATIANLSQNGTIAVAQLHGSEDAAYLERLRALAPGLEIWQAVRVTGPYDVARGVASPADLVLFDAGAGEGRAFNWALLANVERPFGLAGGLNPNNVAEAIRAVHPALVDTSTGIEASPASPHTGTRPVKDPQAMAAFAANARAASQS